MEVSGQSDVVASSGNKSTGLKSKLNKTIKETSDKIDGFIKENRSIVNIAFGEQRARASSSPELAQRLESHIEKLSGRRLLEVAMLETFKKINVASGVARMILEPSNDSVPVDRDIDKKLEKAIVKKGIEIGKLNLIIRNNENLFKSNESFKEFFEKIGDRFVVNCELKKVRKNISKIDLELNRLNSIYKKHTGNIEKEMLIGDQVATGKLQLLSFITSDDRQIKGYLLNAPSGDKRPVMVMAHDHEKSFKDRYTAANYFRKTYNVRVLMYDDNDSDTVRERVINCKETLDQAYALSDNDTSKIGAVGEKFCGTILTKALRNFSKEKKEIGLLINEHSYASLTKSIQKFIKDIKNDKKIALKEDEACLKLSIKIYNFIASNNSIFCAISKIAPNFLKKIAFTLMDLKELKSASYIRDHFLAKSVILTNFQGQEDKFDLLENIAERESTINLLSIFKEVLHLDSKRDRSTIYRISLTSATRPDLNDKIDDLLGRWSSTDADYPTREKNIERKNRQIAELELKSKKIFTQHLIWVFKSQQKDKSIDVNYIKVLNALISDISNNPISREDFRNFIDNSHISFGDLFIQAIEKAHENSEVDMRRNQEELEALKRR